MGVCIHQVSMGVDEPLDRDIEPCPDKQNFDEAIDSLKCNEN